MTKTTGMYLPLHRLLHYLSILIFALHRYMAASDLSTEISKDIVKLDASMEKRVLDALIK